MVVKDNHKTLHRKLKVFFDGPCLFDAEIASHQTCGGEHGRLETRQLSSSDDLPARYTGFCDVQQVFRIRRQVIHKSTGVIREETVYGLTSLPRVQAGPKLLQSLLRHHWHIENKSHWVRDVVFDEDHSQVRCGNIPQVMAALRNTVIGLLRLHGKHQIAATLRRHAARPEEALELLGIPKTE
jgi:predicted transposase YbfD/YdcC